MISAHSFGERSRAAHRGLACVLALALCACSTGGVYQQNLMNAPDIFDHGGIDPFADITAVDMEDHYGILYATDRAPADEPMRPPFYSNSRGHVLRLGSARISVEKEGVTWDEVRRVSLLKNRTEEFPLRVKDVTEYGVLDRSVTDLDESTIVAHKSALPGTLFAERVNAQLARTSVKDVFIYTHGFRVNFENPLLVASELWHYLGYEGVFIAYSWPATPSLWAYAYDMETAAFAGRNLRIFLQYLADETDAERIHIVGYSAGTRVVAGALWQLALLNDELDKATIQKKLRLRHVILAGSDLDAGVFGGHLVDGIWKVPAHLSIYASATDAALNVSSIFFFGKRRLGAWGSDDTLSPTGARILRERDDLLAIHVGDAANSDAGNGHAYFRDSPWVSSDILMTLRYDLLPEKRGLVRTDEDPVWRFPPDYIENLRDKILRVDPELAERTKRQPAEGNQ